MESALSVISTGGSFRIGSFFLCFNVQCLRFNRFCRRIFSLNIHCAGSRVSNNYIIGRFDLQIFSGTITNIHFIGSENTYQHTNLTKEELEKWAKEFKAELRENEKNFKKICFSFGIDL